MNKPYCHSDRPVDIQLGHTLELGPAVLAADIWAYVDHYLIKKETSGAGSAAGSSSLGTVGPVPSVGTSSSATPSVGVGSSRFFWRQAQHFAQGLSVQPYESQPLHLYYAMLNATKAMLTSASVAAIASHHGLSFRVDGDPSKTALDGLILVKQSGVFLDLCRLMGDPVTANTSISLRQLLGLIVGVHRAYCMASETKEQLIPLVKPMRLHTDGANMFWFESELADSVNLSSVVIPIEFNVNARTVSTQAINLNNGSPAFSSDLADYHRICRRQISVIYSRARTSHYIWEISPNPSWSQISLNFALGLALSSLARYHPEKLHHLYEDKMGWVVKEYLRTAMAQYVAFVSAEMTGRLIQQPYASL